MPRSSTPGPIRPLMALLVVLAAGGLVACGGGGPAPATLGAGSVGPSTSVAPSGSIPPSGSGPASAAPSAASSDGADPDAGAALDAFRAFVQTEQSFHLQADMQMTVGGRSIDMDVAADIAGTDEHGDIIVRGGDSSVHLEVVVLDGIAYARLANRPWEQAPLETSSSNPLATLDVEGLEPVGVVNVGGTRTHHFRVNDPAAIDTSLISSASITDIEIDDFVYDIYITDDGAPLAAIMEFSGSGAVAGTRQPIEARIRYDFSRFGEPFDIEKPT